MVARRIRIESTSKTEESETGNMLTKVIDEAGQGGNGKVFPIIVVVMILLAGFHAYDAYNEEMMLEEE